MGLVMLLIVVVAGVGLRMAIKHMQRGTPYRKDGITLDNVWVIRAIKQSGRPLKRRY